MRKLLITAAIVAMLAAPIGNLYAEEKISVTTNTSQSIEETIKSDQKQILEKFKKELSKKFDYQTIDSIFNNPDFKIEKGVMNNWKGLKADSGEKIIIRNYEDYKKALEIEKIFELKPHFMKEYDDALGVAEKRYNVNKESITGVIGAESKFGFNRGKYKTVNALASTYVLVEIKRDFALAQLIELIKYSKKTNISLSILTSSYTGATGFSQFLPWSLNKEYVGESGDITKAHPNNMRDAIFSSAHYLDRRGFKKNPDRAIWLYNNSEWYVRAVKEIAFFDKK